MLITSVWSKLQKHFLSIHDCGGNLHQAQPLCTIYFLLFANARLTYLVIGSISDFGTLNEIVCVSSLYWLLRPALSLLPPCFGLLAFIMQPSSLQSGKSQALWQVCFICLYILQRVQLSKQRSNHSHHIFDRIY
jgi:hypothetical protein